MAENQEAQNTAEPEKEKTPDLMEGTRLKLSVTPDNMQAAINGEVDPGLDRKRVQYALTQILKDYGIRHGLLSTGILAAIDKLASGEKLTGHPVASGTPPEEGSDAYIEPLVELVSNVVGKTSESGHIDFRDRGPLPVVTPGTPVARLFRGVPGKPGRDVYGREIRAPEIRTLRFNRGKGVTLEEENTLLVSSVQGVVTNPAENKYEVLNVLEIDGDVDYNVGHIDFPGLVRVKGAVMPDFRVKSTSLHAETLEPESIVEIEEDLVVRGGIMGAKVKVDGNITTRFMRDCFVECKGNITVETELVACRIECGGAFKITARDGRIVNSTIRAIKGVMTGDILSSSKNATEIQIGAHPEFVARLGALRRELEALEEKLEAVEENVTVQAQDAEALEKELREMIELCRQSPPEEQKGIICQLQLLKPMRENLREGLAEGEAQMETLTAEVQELRARVAEMEALVPTGAVWLDVRGRAEPTTVIRGSRSIMTLNNIERHFSAREAGIKDKASGKQVVIIKLANLRSQAM
ncbi:MAG: FapA family protein [Deltaproteobacteria bacterium]|nr:FapA family protein [Deltaproteobacteria bacterium]